LWIQSSNIPILEKHRVQLTMPWEMFFNLLVLRVLNKALLRAVSAKSSLDRLIIKEVKEIRLNIFSIHPLGGLPTVTRAGNTACRRGFR
jgi:hypothetical protein